ncbi:hypothetical protein VI817_008521 [Penicillium citrinum]|nr:hypothetical protein VI817_008521 [Penicillium citrinum]
MVPQILHRVIHGRSDPEPWQKALLKFQPATLHGFKRHRVRGADYPGIISVKTSAADVSANDTSVLGTLVSGLTDGDIYRLDMFEGEDYTKEDVCVRLLLGGGNAEGNNLQNVLGTARTEDLDEGEELRAVTYVWTGGREELEEAEWDFESFKRDKLAWWVGADEERWKTL